MSEVDFLVKVRDAAAIVLDACQERLEKLGPKASGDRVPDLSQIIWKQTTGPKGAFEVAEAKTNEKNVAFNDLIAYLQAHDGKATIEGFFAWKFTDSSGSVGRKPSRS